MLSILRGYKNIEEIYFFILFYVFIVKCNLKVSYSLSLMLRTHYSLEKTQSSCPYLMANTKVVREVILGHLNQLEARLGLSPQVQRFLILMVFLRRVGRVQHRHYLFICTYLCLRIFLAWVLVFLKRWLRLSFNILLQGFRLKIHFWLLLQISSVLI